MSLAGKTIVITGGGSGLGSETARHAAKAGANVVIVGRREDMLKKVAQEIGGNAVLTVQGDVTKDADWARIKADTVARFGPGVHMVFANAGFEGANVPLDASSDAQLLQVFAVNNVGALLAVKHFSDQLALAKGAVVITSSIAALITPATSPLDTLAPYAASKAAVDSMVKGLHLSLQTRGVSIYGVNPCVYSSEMVDKIVTNVQMAAMGMAEPAKFAFGFNPLGNLGHPVDVAKVVLAIADGTSKVRSGESVGVMPSHEVGEPIVSPTGHFYEHMASYVPLNAFYLTMPILNFRGEPVSDERVATLRTAIKTQFDVLTAVMAGGQK